MSVQEKGRKRYGLLDSFRGLVLISMLAYHGSWDLVYLFQKNWTWYRGTGAYIWQQSICWSFILLSGFCWPLGRKPLKRGLMVFGAGALVSVATLLFMPEERVVFGVLTLIGSCMLCMVLPDKLFQKLPPEIGLAVSITLFVFTRNINNGFLGFESWNILRLPGALYRDLVTTFLGFPEPGFFSTDYFSFFPWIFLFLSGYFIYHIMDKNKGFMDRYFVRKQEPFAFLGRHSLEIYMLHQPVIFGLLSFMDMAGLV